MEKLELKAWLLKIADEVEAKPSKWTKRYFALDIDLKPVGANKPTAASWCATGFIYRDYGNIPIGGSVFHKILKILSLAAEDRNVASFNDSLQSFEEFVSWFRRGTEYCE